MSGRPKTHRQNAAALARQEQADMMRLIKDYEAGKDIAALLKTDTELRRRFERHGTCEEAVVTYIEANYKAARTKTRTKKDKE